MARTESPYENIHGLVEETTLRDAEGRLDQGFILINTYITSSMDEGCLNQTLHYVLGVPRREKKSDY